MHQPLQLLLLPPTHARIAHVILYPGTTSLHLLLLLLPPTYAGLGRFILYPGTKHGFICICCCCCCQYMQVWGGSSCTLAPSTALQCGAAGPTLP
jgi:hypothetical protein